MNPLSKTPFLFLLVPLIVGIFIQYYLHIELLSILFFVLGVGFILNSFFVKNSKSYNLRWSFGVGLFFVIISIGIISTVNRQKESENTFDTKQQIYKGIVTNIPQDKPRSTAYKVILPDYNKNIVCYFQLDSTRAKLKPGDEFIFRASIQAFQNTGNPNDFDYASYMYNQGFAGSAYIPKHSWVKTGQTSISPQIIAQRYRQQILNFYKSLGFDNTEYAIISALTVGYQDALSDDIKQSFRTTGTVHVLSVSGLHVGIIYIMISFFLGFVKRTSRLYRLKPILIILLLWIYAFLAGLAPSVTRASLMLTMFCLSEVFSRRSYSIHSMYIAAFLILLWNPFSFFHIGFQFSFLSVAAILYLQPIVSKIWIVKNEIGRRIWSSFTLSCVAQLATFPLCIYYFGTFPTYFFITNLIIVPLVTFIIYSFGMIILSGIIHLIIPSIGNFIIFFSLKIVHILLYLLTKCVTFFENLPFALVQDINISLLGLLALCSSILILLKYFQSKKTIYLKICFCIVIASTLTCIYDNLNTGPESLTIYKKQNETAIKWTVNKQSYNIDDKDLNTSYKLIDVKGIRILVISKNCWKNKVCSERFKLDYVLLVGKEQFDIHDINRLFSFNKLILDNTLSRKQALRLVNELQKLKIPYYDISQNGAYRIIF